MKFTYLILITCFLATSALAQENYYWYKGQKVILQEDPTKQYVLMEASLSKSNLQNQMRTQGVNLERYGQTSIYGSLTPYNDKATAEKMWGVVEASSALAANTALSGVDVLYQAPYFKTQEGVSAGLSHLFYVKLKQADDVSLLEKLAETHGLEILGKNKFMPLWYTLACDKNATGNALAMANLFYETGEFAASEPDLMVDDRPECTNDPYIDSQWALKNTGQGNGISGNDIRACNAWISTKGSANVIVAILDHGIELNHPDMPNISPNSFDTESGTSPSRVLGSHGVACAGIVGAAHNNEGVAGIAPSTTLMSISNSLVGNPNSRQKRADGFNYAWQNGAAIISNSWGSGVRYQIIDDAIENTIKNGRGGLGTMVLFSSGNSNRAVGYPANANPDIIAVGAASPCGERKNPNSCDGERWGSNFGAELDVIAPGVLIPTTDRQGSAGYNRGTSSSNFANADYTNRFNGTSAACPQVAGVAALVLAINPNLTQLEVSNIIEQTARKTGNYNYSNTTGRPNGTWNNEAGYGLVDAEAAVKAAKATLTPNLAQSNLNLSDIEGRTEVSNGSADVSNAFTVFPNPVSDFATFSFNNTAIEEAAIQLYSSNGNVITANLVGDRAQALKLDVSGLPNGLYFYQMITNSGTFNGKLVVRH